jgi:hypothetical protein
MKTQILTSIVTAAAAFVLSAPKAQALTTDNLADLDAGASLAIGDATFSGFASSAPRLAGFNPALITVTASASGNVDYLTWTTSFSEPPNTLGDVTLDYNVKTSAGLITGIGQQATGSGLGGTGSFTVADNVIDAITSGLVASVSITSSSPSGSSSFAGQNDLDVKQDVFLLGGSAGAEVTQLQESFSETPATAPDGGITLILLSSVMSAMTLIRAKVGKLE